MLVSTHPTWLQHLSKKAPQKLSHSLRRHYYRQRSAASPPCIDRNEDHAKSGHISQLLPVPPLLDAIAIHEARRLKARLPKPRQDAASQTTFQKRLAANPYARALATPVRQCSITGTRLPNHFLVPFTTQFRECKPSDSGLSSLSPYLALHTDRASPGPKTSLINSISSLRHLRKKKGWQRLISRDMHDRYNIKDKKAWSWPEHIEDVVLEHLRQSAFAKLKWAFTMPNAKLVKPFRAGDTCVEQGSCVLRLGHGENLTTYHGEADSLFDLPQLLGQELVKTLTHGTSFAACDAVTVAESPLTTLMVVRLAKLRGFVDERL